MVDIFSKEKRHEIMSKIRSKETKIEIKVRKFLYSNGIRYRKNCNNIIGKPDIAIKKYKIAIFINGCFWHGHENCKSFHLPKENTEFWDEKIRRNRANDYKNQNELTNQGWNVFVLWECQIERLFEDTMNELLGSVIKIIKSHKKD